MRLIAPLCLIFPGFLIRRSRRGFLPANQSSRAARIKDLARSTGRRDGFQPSPKVGQMGTRRARLVLLDARRTLTVPPSRSMSRQSSPRNSFIGRNPAKSPIAK